MLGLNSPTGKEVTAESLASELGIVAVDVSYVSFLADPVWCERTAGMNFNGQEHQKVQQQN